MNGMTRTMHRLVGITLALPLFVWILTGVLFNVKYRYTEAYETLEWKPAAAQSLWGDAHVSPAELVASGKLDGAGKLTLFIHPSKIPAYAGVRAGTPVAVNAS